MSENGTRSGALGHLLQVDDVWKSFGLVVALRGASLWANHGELTAIVGDNGAGKSTLIKCVSGVLSPDHGEIRLSGAAVVHRSAEDARRGGVETVYQDLALVDDLAVYQNVYIDRELTWGWGPLRLLSRKAMERETQKLLETLNVSVPSVRARVRRLSGGQRQAVAIARGMMWGTELVILDEPTAALGVRETAKVESLILDLVARGVAVLMISHNLEQVRRISSRIWVMRGGHVVGGLRTQDASDEQIVGMITGLVEEAPNPAAERPSQPSIQ